MSINIELQSPNLASIPFTGSGPKLIKKELKVGAKVQLKDISGNEITLSVLSEKSGLYSGETEDGKSIEFKRDHVFLILQ